MTIVLHLADQGGDQTVLHDLNFTKNRYEVVHNLNFPTNRPDLYNLLQESGPVPLLKGSSHSKNKIVSDAGVNSRSGSPAIAGDSAGALDSKGKLENASQNSKLKKKSKPLEKGSIDLERLAEGLQQLGEDDLLGVVQMVTDNKTLDMCIKNDVDEGEFHMDLYTLPDSLLKSLWDYVKKRIDT